ncbi:MAG: anti-sigma factor [Oleiphilaceae bacterium]|nr:anti-sigma factor [Oleiphilaceae bacterium]
MKKTPERVEQLAAAYVLGTLEGPARRRFQRWMMESASVRREVWFWEEKLSELAHVIPPEEPPARVWQALEKRLWPETAPNPSAGSRLSAWLMPGWSLLATAAALVLAVILVQQPEPEPETPWSAMAGAIVEEDVEEPLWLVSEDSRSQRLHLRPVAAQAPQPDKDYELWVVPEDGSSPISLGVIPVSEDRYQIQLTPEVREALERSRTLAISLEPEGGSPSGAPTGPILHVTRMYDL